MGAMGKPTWPCTMLRHWASVMKFVRSARLPGRRPRSRSAQFGGPEVRMKLTLFAPMRRSWAGLRARSVNSRGALARCCATKARSRRTRLLPRSTEAPWAAKMSRASAFKISRPKFSRMRMEASWMASICSARSTSMGAKGLAIRRQAGWARGGVTRPSRCAQGRRRFRPDDDGEPDQDDDAAQQLHERHALDQDRAAGDDTRDGHQQLEGDDLVDAIAPQQPIPERIGQHESADGEDEEEGPETEARRGD